MWSDSAFGHDDVVFREHKHAGLPVRRLSCVDLSEAHDGEAIALLPEMSGRAIQDDRARATLASDGVRLEAFAVAHVAAENLLIRQQADALHQVRGDSEASFVVHVGIRHLRPVYLRFQEMN